MSPVDRISEKAACSFTGHRPARLGIRGPRDPALDRLRERLWEEILRLHHRGIHHFFSGMALGVDIWCAELVLHLRQTRPEVRLHCVLPCFGQEKNWREAERRHYQALLFAADEVFYLTEGAYTRGCMQLRNRYLVERSGTLLAVYDGKSGGGTAYTVDYARKLRREVVLLTPETAAGAGGGLPE